MDITGFAFWHIYVFIYYTCIVLSCERNLNVDNINREKVESGRNNKKFISCWYNEQKCCSSTNEYYYNYGNTSTSGIIIFM